MSRRFLYTLLAAVLPATLFAQGGDSSIVSIANHRLTEIEIRSTIPLNTNQIVNFYQPNHFTSLDPILARIDGVSMIKRGAYAQEPQLNGFSGGQLSLTIDGMHLFGACTDKMDPITSYIEPTNLKSLATTQGVNGCSTGCNIGGSIDFTLKEAQIGSIVRHSNTFGIGYESISNGRTLLFSTVSTGEKWGYTLESAYRKNEDYRDGYQHIIPYSQFRKENIHSSILYQPKPQRRFKLDLLYDAGYQIGYPALPMDVALARATLIALDYQQQQQRFPIKAKLYYNFINHRMDDSKRDSLFILNKSQTNKGDSVFMRMDMPGRSSTVGAYIQIHVPWAVKNNLTIKAENYTNYSLAEMTMHMHFAGKPLEKPMYLQTWPAMLRSVSGLFIENSIQMSDRLTLLVNGRIDFNTDRVESVYGKQQFSIFHYSLPRQQNNFAHNLNLSNSYNFSPNLGFILTIGHGERIPTISERLGFYLYNAYDGYDYIGNPNLKNEKSTYIRLTTTWTKSKVKIKFNIAANYLSNYIMGITDTTIPKMNIYAKATRVYQNRSQSNVFNEDIQIMYMPFSNVSLFLSSKYSYGVINEREPMPLIAPLQNFFATQIHIRDFFMQLEFENAWQQKRINRDYGEIITPSYTVLNFKLGKTFWVKNKRIESSLGLNNILDKVYYAHLDFGRINRPGRGVELFLNYRF